jgi:beta-N-acetylhexosaminidase
MSTTRLAIAVDARARASLDEDLAPFAALAPRLGAVMLAHVVYPAVDGAPAGYSARWIGGVLRGELGFAGAALSDDLGMAGGAGPGGYVARAQAALDAGCDAVLVCNALNEVDALLAGVRWQPTPAHSSRLRALAGGAGVRPGDPAFREAQALLAAM